MSFEVHWGAVTSGCPTHTASSLCVCRPCQAVSRVLT